MTISLLWNGYRYFPYERKFAKREVEAITGIPPVEIESVVTVPETGLPIKMLQRLTYFGEIVLPDGRRLIPEQARLEASSWRGSKVGDDDSIDHYRRQSTRYSAHGLHEYRGKFNPQIVRAIGNMLKLPEGAWVLDPFCGSGTTLLECAHVGWNAVGIDLNPIGVLISNAKLKAVHTPSTELETSAWQLSRLLMKEANRLEYEREWSHQEMESLAGPNWAKSLPNFEYLRSWFPMPVLAQFAAILQGIRTCVESVLVPIFQVILSDLVRLVSFQDPGDLRVRRRKQSAANYPVIPMFLEALDKRLATVTNARAVINPPACRQEAYVGDSRLPLDWIYKQSLIPKNRGFEAAITSPPYATALPYIDTQRLSLCLLGLLRSNDIMQLDRRMIGTREILNSKRKTFEASMANARVEMPESVLGLCRRMLGLSASPMDGFRRRNMPALIYSYFYDMSRVLANVRQVLRQGGSFAIIVGCNRTTLGGQSIFIDTPQLLADIASSNGWLVKEIMELDTYHRFDVHQRNSIRTESLILLERTD